MITVQIIKITRKMSRDVLALQESCNLYYSLSGILTSFIR